VITDFKNICGHGNQKIRTDMGTNAQIESFIAGDVGSGKTIVAL
jgi:RecG-like helicase